MYRRLICTGIVSLLLTGCGSDSNELQDSTTLSAGSDTEAIAGYSVALSGTISDSDDVEVKWTQLSGTEVQITNSDAVTASFTAPSTINDAVLEFQLQVTDSSGNTLSDTINITIKNKKPDAIAIAGPDRKGSVVATFTNPQVSEITFFDGSQSSGTSFTWSVTASPDSSQYAFTSENTPSTGFYAETAGEYTLQIVADNGQDDSDSDTVLVTILNDADNDGINDADDLDRDGDGFLNTADMFPDNRASHLDFDADNIGNYDETDVDEDGTFDIEDDYPLDPNLITAMTYNESSETSIDNQNDGISVSETAGSPPLRVTGYTYSSSGTDIDYFKVSMTTGIYSVVLYTDNVEMSPSIALISSSGVSLPSTDSNFIKQPGIIGSGFSIPSNGDYYLVITDASGNSASDWSYRAEIFADTDMDGLGNELEQAIDSNDLSADSDGDTIPDFIEYQSLEGNWSNNDIDGDGLPAWWDMDSDGDSIPDNVEYYLSTEKPSLDIKQLYLLNDADKDGIPNFIDTNSDGTAFTNDTEQAGENPTSPIDTDSDGTPDFIDLDNDGDGLNDTQENVSTYNSKLQTPGSEGTNVADALMIKSIWNTSSTIDNVCISDQTLSVEVSNAPSSAADLFAVFNTLDGAEVQTATSLSNDIAIFTCPDNIATGLVDFYLATDRMRSGSVAIQYLDSTLPLLTSVSYNSNTADVIISGENLSTELTIDFNGDSTTVDYSSSSITEFSISLPSSAKTGYVTVTSVNGESNALWLNLTRLISGTIVSPNSSVNLSELDVALTLDNEITPDESGVFTTDVSYQEPTTISALLEKSKSTPENPQYTTYLSAVVFPDSTDIILSAESTAMTFIWDGLGINELIDETDLTSSYSTIAQLTELQDLTSLLEKKLSLNSEVISEENEELNNAITAAMLATLEGLDSYSIVSPTTTQASVRGLFGDDAEVSPSEADDIKIYEYDDSGNVALENDTQLYLSAKITATDGTVLQEHITGLSGMAGPQGYGLIFRASTTEYKHPNGQNAVVEVISPGIGADYAPSSVSNFSVWKWLYFRTVTERVLLPVLTDILPLPDSEIVNIIWSNAPGIVDVVVTKALDGDVSGSIKALSLMVWQDFASSPPGPITQALAKKYGTDIAEDILAKIAAKIGAKFVPGVGQIALAVEVAGAINTGSNVAKAIFDMGSTDAAINFNVVFPLSVESVQPSKVLADETDTTLLLSGTGFSEIQRGWWPLESYLQPAITISDQNGLEVTATVESISTDGTTMYISIPGWYLTDTVEGPLSLEINHPSDEPDAIVTLSDAIEIVTELELTSISPEQGGSGVTAILYGVGFNASLNQNEVLIGGETALISAASETSLTITIPSELTEGEHNVAVRVIEDGTWGDFSDPLTYEVIQGDVTIVVCDNGGAKDDAFALYVDGSYLGTMYASNSDYCDTYTPSLDISSHSALLLGVEAPDSIGTYSIDFSGVSNLSGPATSGYDLTPGVNKYYEFDVSAKTTSTTKSLLQTTQRSLRSSYSEENIEE